MSCVSQVLLRVSPVWVWLTQHAILCLNGAARCVACALHGTAGQLGLPARPVLAARRAIVHESFAQRQHDVCEFAELMIDAMRTQERNAQRIAKWTGVLVADGVAVATQVDKLFAFVEELRLECSVCGMGRRKFERATVMKLPVPPDVSQIWSVSDLHLLACAKEESPNVMVECPSEICCHARTLQAVQRRVVTCPRILLVQVRRQSEDGSLIRFPVLAEDQFSLPALGTFDLAGCIYHVGHSSHSGHYTCASRGPDGCFWYFDDARQPRRLGRDVGEFKQRHVAMLAYVVSSSEHSQHKRPMDVQGRSRAEHDSVASVISIPGDLGASSISVLGGSLLQSAVTSDVVLSPESKGPLSSVAVSVSELPLPCTALSTLPCTTVVAQVESSHA